jgi:ParB family transcriptional regulator, chromosome partitioning protein
MNEKRKPLGRGLDSLLPATRAAAAPARSPADAASTPAGEIVQEVPVENIEANPYQTRGRLDASELAELSASIVATGVLQPVVLRDMGQGKKFQLIAGERRWRASQSAGKATVPAIIRRVSNVQAMEMTIIENLQRSDLNAMEQARAFDRLGRDFKLTQEQIASRTGKDRATIANFLRLLKLPPEVQALVETGQLSMGHAKALMMLDNPPALLETAARISERGLSVRQTEELVHSLVDPSARPARKAKAEAEVDPNVVEVQRELERVLGCKIRITDRNGKGSISIDYKSLDEFDRLLDALGVTR